MHLNKKFFWNFKKKCCKKRTFFWCNFSCIFKKNRLDERRPEVENYSQEIAQYLTKRFILPPSDRSIICLVYQKTGQSNLSFFKDTSKEVVIPRGTHHLSYLQNKNFLNQCQAEKAALFYFSYFRREVLSRYCGIARCAENKKGQINEYRIK